MLCSRRLDLRAPRLSSARAENKCAAAAGENLLCGKLLLTIFCDMAFDVTARPRRRSVVREMGDMEEKALRLLRNGVVVVLALALIAGIFLPVYTDEVGWRFQERAGIDGVDKLFNDICGPNTLAVPPLFMMPVRYYSAYLNLWFADPLYVRISGILYALVWLAMLLALIRRIVSDRREQVALGLCAFGLMGLANMPLLLVWSRPEQPLVLTLTAALLLAFADRWPANMEKTPPEASARTAWWRSLAILCLAIVALSYHVKAVFLMPVFLACLCFASRGRASLLPRIAVGGVLAVVVAIAASYWIHRLQCPDDPRLRAAYASQNFGMELSGVDSGQALLGLVGELLGNINLWKYGWLALPHNRPMSGWLPAWQIDPTGTSSWAAIYLYFWGGVAIFAFIGLFRGIRTAINGRVADPRVILSVLLAATVIGWSATQLSRNVYEAILALPLLMLSAVLAMSAARMGERATLFRNMFAGFLGLSAVVSVVLTAGLWGESLARSNAQAPYIKEQSVSVPVFGYARQKPIILAAARQCGIPEPHKAKGLLVDDLTYFAFMESKLPQHRLGVLSTWSGSIKDPVDYLKSRGSDGIILGCHLLSDDLRRRAKGQGGFCCLGPPGW
jgi:hypothetical protein